MITTEILVIGALSQALLDTTLEARRKGRNTIDIGVVEDCCKDIIRITDKVSGLKELL